MKKKKDNLDEFYYHEALNSALYCSSMIESTLIEHPVFKKHKDIKAKVEKVKTLLWTHTRKLADWK